MSSCGAEVGGTSLENVDLTNQAVIQGVVRHDEYTFPPGYVRLNNKDGEFVAEVPLSKRGEFRFFTKEGNWTVMFIIPGKIHKLDVETELNKIIDLDIEVDR
jgi:hypothetical protein